MNKSTKGAVAAAAAAALLLGGAGSLAYWSDSADAPGGDIVSGHLRMGNTPACGDWTLDSGEDVPGAVFDPATGTLVPGDVISRDCDVTVEAEGDHLRATVEATPGTSTGMFVGASPMLTLAVSNISASPDGGVTAFAPLTGTPQEITEGNDGDTLRITTTVTFDTNASDPLTTQDITSVLDAITLTASQVHG